MNTDLNFYSIACEQWQQSGAAIKGIEFIGRDNAVKVITFLNSRGAVFVLDTWSDGVFSVTVSEFHIDETQSFIETLEGAAR